MRSAVKNLSQGDSEEVILRKKLSELQTRVQKLENQPPSGSSAKRQEYGEKDKSGIGACLEVKGKIDWFRDRNRELEMEAEMLRLELARLQEESEQLQEIRTAFGSLERDLRERQHDRIELRKKLEVAETKNSKMVDELNLLREDLERIMAKAQDDETLLQALQAQQTTFEELSERQRQLRASEHRRYCEQLRELKARHATNTELLARLKEADRDAEERVAELRCPAPLAFYAMGEDDEEEEAKPHSEVFSSEADSLKTEITSATTEDHSAEEHSVEQLPPPPAEDPNVAAARAERDVLKNMFESAVDEVERMSEIAISNNEKLKSWKNQLLQSRAILFQKSAEVWELQEKSKPGGPSMKDSKETKEELITRQEVENEEHKFLLSYWHAVSEHWDSLYRIYLIGTDRSKKLYLDVVKEKEARLAQLLKEEKERLEAQALQERLKREEEEANLKSKKGKGKKGKGKK